MTNQNNLQGLHFLVENNELSELVIHIQVCVFLSTESVND